MMKFGKHGLGAACVVVLLAIGTGHAGAAGAIAVGVAPGGAQRGFSFGMSSNKATEEIARADVLQACRTSKQSNDKARARCTVVGILHDQCGSVAMDPKDGTPGVGWAIAVDAAAAKTQALANCEATAGPDRSGTCKVSATRCDGAAQ